MDREDGMRILSYGGWLGATPTDFQGSVLTASRRQHLQAGKSLQAGGEEEAELIGLASGSRTDWPKVFI